MRRFEFFLFSMAVLMACAGPPARQSEAELTDLEAVVHDRRPDISFTRLKAVMVLSEEGCITCNRSFAEFLSGHVADSTILIWLTAVGKTVDISPFKENRSRVVEDYDRIMEKTHLVQGSSIILLDSGRVDTILHLSGRTVEQSLAMASARLR
jgi:hypothetical protein